MMKYQINDPSIPRVFMQGQSTLRRTKSRLRKTSRHHISLLPDIYLHRLSLIFLVVLHLHVIEAQHLILLKSPIPQKFIHVPILSGGIGVLHERPRQRVYQSQRKFPLPVAHGHQIGQQCLHALSEFLVAVDEGVVIAEMVMDLLEQTLNSGKHTAQSPIVQLQFHLRDFDVAGLAFEEIALEVFLVLDVEGEHEGLFSHLAAILGLSGVVPAVLAGEAHDDEIREIGDAGPAAQHLPRLEAHLAGDLETDWLVRQEIGLLERLHEVQLVAHKFSLLLVLQLRLDSAGVVAHRQELFFASFEGTNLHVLVDPRSEGVFNVGVAAWVPEAQGQREVLPLDVGLQLLEEGLQFGLLLCLAGVADDGGGEVLVGAGQDGLNGRDLGSLGWRQGQLQFLDLNRAVLRLDHLPIQVLRGHTPEQDFDTVIRQPACELDLVVGLAAVGAGEGANEDLPEEGDAGQEDGGLAGLMASGALGLCD